MGSSTLALGASSGTKKLLLMPTGEGGGDNCGELAASISFASSPIRPAVSATIADNSASSSSSSSDDEDDDEHDEEDEEADDDDDEDDEEEDDVDRDGEVDDECVFVTVLVFGSSKSLATNRFSLFAGLFLVVT